MKNVHKTNHRLPRWSYTVINSAVTMAIAALCAPTVFAACDANITSVLTAPCSMSATGSTTISASGAINLSTATAPAISVDNLATGVSINNSGTIAVNGGVNAIRVDAAATGTTIINQSGGIISAVSNTALLYAGALDGSLTNHGRIEAVTSAFYGAGVTVSGALSGGLTNTGTISGVINGVSTMATTMARAYGVYVGGDLSGSLNNSGTIAADAHSAGSASALGIYVQGNLSTSLVNSGTISATANNATGGAYASGIHLGNMSSGASITNSGTVSATATGLNNAFAYGIDASNMVTSSINNSGHITASAITTGGSGSAVGIRATSVDAGSTITNSGTIVASGTDTSAYSISAGSGTGNVINSGSLSGMLNLGGTINMSNSGLLSIADSTGGTSAIGGNYSQSGNGILQIGAGSSTNYNKLTVGGTADFSASNKLSVKVAPTNTLANNDVLDNVVSATTLVPVSSYHVTDNSLAWQFSAQDDGASHIDLTATSTGLTTFETAAAGTAMSSIATALDSMLAANPNAITTELDSLTSLGSAAEVATALHSLSPELASGAATLDVLHSGSMNVVNEQMRSANGLSSGDGVKKDRIGWIKPFAARPKQNDRNGLPGYKANSYGLMVGADQKVSKQWRIGTALAYANSKVKNSSDTQKVDIKTYQIAVYGSDRINDVTALNLQFGLGTNRNNSTRDVLGGVASGRYNSAHMLFSAELERLHQVNSKTSLTPALGLEYARVKVNGYTESGSPLALNNGKLTQTALIISAGSKAGYKLNDQSKLTGHLNVGYDTKAKQSSITSTFVGGGSTFVTQGIKPSATLIRAGVGYEAEQANSRAFQANYDIEGRSGYTNHMVSLNFKQLF
ncbi:MAG: autotransporter domain-containing protein [Gallionellaceae bacterium]|nr:autotransporter domain-containing protein [Gallionellaceae bacterium]